MSDVLCPICGRPNSDLREFCDFCGNPLDGALRVEGEADSGDGLLGNLPPEPLDDASRLDDLVPAPEDDLPAPAGDDQPLNGDFRLESLLADDLGDPLETDPPSPESLNGGSRLDDYLPVDQPPADLEPGAQGADDLSRLDEYLSPEKPQEELPLDVDSLSASQEDDASRLDDYLKPEIPAEQAESDGGTSLEDFFDADPFKRPDPFQEPPSGQADGADPFRIGLDPFAEPPASESQFGDWDFLEPASQPDQSEEDPAGESIDAGEWDFLHPSPTPEGPDADSPTGPLDAGEWDFLDPAPTPDRPEEQPADSQDAGEWDFLDPGPAGSDQEGGAPLPEGSEPDTPDDWDFLDPGPAADLPDQDGEGELRVEGDGEDAGWLDMLEDPEARRRAEPRPGTAAEPSKPETDWLDKIKRLNQSSDLVDEDSSFPDWLSVTGKTAEFKTDPSGESPESADDVPDWLQLDDDESLNEFLRRKDLTNEEYKPKITTDSLDDTAIAEDADLPGPELSDSQQIKFPSWAEERKKKASLRRDAQAGADRKGDLQGAAEPFQIEEEFFDDLFSEELPAWLTAASSGEVTPPVGEDLALGELPGWVEAMRPVVESADASGLDDDEEYIENYGPLAGIPSVLPAEAEIGIDLDQAIKKPLDLLTTKKHQDYVNLLNKLIEDENKSKTAQLPSPLQTQRVLRWLISVVTLVAIAGTLIFSTSIEPGPLNTAQVSGSGIAALYDEIETLYDGQPVLIAFDYQPAAAGELHTAAATVVDHLMEQGTFLTFISTQPTGPALAEHFLDTTQSHHNYIHTQKYINLGYLPGESAGLVSFLIAPQKIIPLAFDGSNAWDSPPLISIDGIGDFKMILVITDDPNTAKIWIEQVGSRLDETPLTMVVSAQVEPLIQPYFRTSPRQLSGYVAGIIDSINYERLTERPFLAAKTWLPFNMGIVISVGIIFISGLANGVLALLSRRKDKEPGESL